MKLASFEAIATALADAGVRYLVAGGLAVNAHGYLRFTKDVDIVVHLVPENVSRAFAALQAIGFRPSVPVFDFDQEYHRALIKPLHERIEVRFVSAGTLIRMKSAAGRPQDHLDIESLRIIERNDD